MASKGALIKYLYQFPRWRNQLEGPLNVLVREARAIPENGAALQDFMERMIRERKLHENAEYRATFNTFWNNPIADYWGYQSEAAEEMLTKALVQAGYPVTVENLEHVWPDSQAKLSASNQFNQHQQKLARDEKDRQDRANITYGLLNRFEYNFLATRQRDGDIQKLQSLPQYVERERRRLESLDINQLRVEERALVADESTAKEAARLQKLNVLELREEVRTQNTKQVYHEPAQAYGNNGHQPLPADYNGKPWTVKLLYSMSPREQDHVMKLYGGKEIDRAIGANRAKGIR